MSRRSDPNPLQTSGPAASLSRTFICLICLERVEFDGTKDVICSNRCHLLTAGELERRRQAVVDLLQTRRDAPLVELLATWRPPHKH